MHPLQFVDLLLDVVEVPHYQVLIVGATKEIVVCEGQGQNPVGVTNELIKTLAGFEVPNTNRVVIRARKEPFIPDSAIFSLKLKHLQTEDPATMPFKSLYVAVSKVVGSNYGVAASDKQPFVKQMQTLDCFLGGNKGSVDLTVLQINCSHLLVPAASKQ